MKKKKKGSQLEFSIAMVYENNHPVDSSVVHT